MNLSQFNKAIMTLVAGALTWGAQVVASSSPAITAPEWLGLAGVAAAAFGVFMIPNTTPAPVKPPAAGIIE